MLIDVAIPQLGESITEGTISRWLVREGEMVAKDQPLVSIGTESSSIMLATPGRVLKP